MLSKSRYLKGLKCHKALWLNHHKKQEAYYPEATLQKFSVGNTAGDIAQDYFPGGELALVDDYANSASAKKTQELLQKGVTTIYEATFIAHNTLVALDILHQIDGKWYGFEVKSTNSVKQEHIRDAAIQYYVIEASGFELEDFSIMHFDRDYVRQGDIDPKGLFTYESVYVLMRSYLTNIPENIETFLEVYQKEEPEVTIGSHCNEPYECEFKNYCHQLPENQALLEQEDAKPLSTEVTYKNDAAIERFLKENPYPIYSLDFETVMYGIPEFDESRPYQQITFQYSLHYQKDKNSEPEHFEFLGNGIDDPREALIQQLIQDIGSTGSILVYSITFERTRLLELARDFPQHKDAIESIIDRLVDLAPIYRKHITTEATQSRWSLKIVQPTFLPHLSYDDLDIQHGMATMDVYKNFATLPKDEALEARKAMLAYCRLDTLAVLELYNKLYQII